MNLSQFSFGLSLLHVSVTARDITQGVSRSCTGCAIAQAVNRSLPRLGFTECHAELVPYALFADPKGLEIWQGYHRLVGNIPASDLPDGLVEWAIEFDDWAEFQDEHGGCKQAWRAANRNSDYPFKPTPVSFTFDMGKLIAPESKVL